jgi:ABC-2 type transport system permease protein/lipopolysaccharide transport system permease protein
MNETGNSNSPEVSVVIPVFNGEKWINRALKSVLSQTFSNLEIIVVDDGSTDQTINCVSQTRSDRLKLVKHDCNRGAAAARNTGIAAARGSWIAFLDADDAWRPDKLARQIKALDKAGNGVMACATGYQLHRHGRELTFSLKWTPKQFRREIVFGCTISPGSTLLVSRKVFSAIGTFDESFQRLEDWDWLLRYANRYDLAFVPMPLADIHQDISSPQPEIGKIEDALNRIRHKHLSDLPMIAKMRLRAFLLVEKAAALYRAGKIPSAVLFILAALSAYPFRNAAFYRMLWRSVATSAVLSNIPRPASGFQTSAGLQATRRVGRLLRKSFFWAWLDTTCQYRRSRIGPFWETVNVAVMIAGLTLVSSTVFGGNIVGHMGYIGTGIIAWTAISAMITEGPSTFVRSSSLITSTSIDSEVYVGRTVFKILITFAHHLIIFVIGAIFLIVPLGWTSLLAIPGIALLFANGFWMVTVLAFVCARFRDLELIVRNLLQLAFFVTPVFWDYQQVAIDRRSLVDLNILFHFLEIIRAPLLGHVPSSQNYLVVLVVTVLGSMFAFFVRRRMRHELAFFVQ